MKPNKNSRRSVPRSLTWLLATCAVSLYAQQPSVAEHVTALKAALASDQKGLRQYEWIETTVISVNGEDKSSKEERCYYGADGGIQKIKIDASTPEGGPRFGLRKRIAEHKKEEMTDFMKDAVALVKSYVPPDAVKIQEAKDAGRASVEILDPGKRVRLDFKDYQKPGDHLGIEVDLTNNQLLGLKVATYVENPSEAVTLNVQMKQLDDGTSYPAACTLAVPSKNLNVEVENSGYRKMN